MPAKDPPSGASLTLNVGQDGNTSYPIHIGKGLRHDLGKLVTPMQPLPDAAAIVVDKNVPSWIVDDCVAVLTGQIPRLNTFPIEPGEASKSLESFGSLTEKLLLWGMSRHSIVMAIGGGVVGDLAGFVASTVLRGVRFLSMPTTLLAAVDSSLGGKTGINSRSGKNLIGSFHRPSLVVSDLDTLTTLPRSVYSHGHAEIVKAGMIADADLFVMLEHLPPNTALDPKAEHVALMIHQACTLKARIVQEDEYEQGRRMALNFGHTFAHGLERLSGYSLPHGQAVAVGMVLATRFSVSLGLCSPEILTRLTHVLEKLELPTSLQEIRQSPSATAMTAAMTGDKKFVSGEMRLVLTRGIGNSELVQKIEPQKLQHWWIREIDNE